LSAVGSVVQLSATFLKPESPCSPANLTSRGYLLHTSEVSSQRTRSYRAPCWERRLIHRATRKSLSPRSVCGRSDRGTECRLTAKWSRRAGPAVRSWRCGARLILNVRRLLGVYERALSQMGFAGTDDIVSISHGEGNGGTFSTASLGGTNPKRSCDLASYTRPR
jgi:hypothetical protein